MIKECPICEKKYKTCLSRIKDGRGKFCSKGCAYRHTRESGIMGGKNNPAWTGGRHFRGTKGYWYIRMPSHHRAVEGYVPEHVLVIEDKLGRELKKGEHVHHLNGIKTDNRPENLIVLTHEQHSHLHSNGKSNPMYGKRFKELLQTIIEFNEDEYKSEEVKSFLDVFIKSEKFKKYQNNWEQLR